MNKYQIELTDQFKKEICKIEDEKLIILALAIAHRKDVYK